MIDCPCGYGNNLKDDQTHCHICGTDLTPLHRVNALRNTYYHLGKKHWDEGKINEAIAYLTAAISLNPKNMDLYLMLAELYSQNKQYSEGMACLEQAQEIEPENKQIQSGILSIREEKGRDEKRTKRSKVRKMVLIAAACAVPALTVLGIILFTGLLKPHIETVFIEKPAPAPAKTPAPMPEETLKPSQAGLQIEQALSRYVSLEAMALDIKTTDTGIVITGEVPSQAHFDLVEAIALADSHGIPVDMSRLMIKKTPVEPVSLHYIVRQGDSLTKIAKIFYQDITLWYVIYEANRGQITNPNKIRIGQELIIPMRE